MKTKKTACLLVILTVLLFMAGCETAADDVQNNTSNVSVVIVKPVIGTASRSVFSSIHKENQIVAYPVSIFDSDGSQIYSEIISVTAFPLTIGNLPVGITTIKITALNKEGGILASGNSVVILVGGKNDYNAKLEWESPVYGIPPEGFHEVIETSDNFSNAEGNMYGFYGYNQNDFNSSTVFYLIEVNKPYYVHSRYYYEDQTYGYQVLTDGNADGKFFTTKIYDNSMDLELRFKAHETGVIRFIGNWLGNSGTEHSIALNTYAFSGYINKEYSKIGKHGQTYRAALEGNPQNYLNVSFDYSAVSYTNYAWNGFVVTVRDSSGNVIIEESHYFPSLATSRDSSNYRYEKYLKSFDVTPYNLNGATIELFGQAGDYEMYFKTAVYAWSNTPHFN